MSGFSDPLARWNERFSAAGYLFGERPNDYLASRAGLLAPGNALSIADGEGRNSVWLASQGLQVDAFDFSPFAVEKARQLSARNGLTQQIRLHCSDWQSFSWPENYYDNVVGIFFQFAPPDERAEIFRRMSRALKPGGILLIQGYGIDQLRFNTGGPGRLDHLYDEALLKDSFPGYVILESVSYEAELMEGSGHRGRSALIGFVAQKAISTAAF